MSITIHCVQGEKGGVGKSVFSLALIHAHVVQKIPLVIVETDRSNGDIARACTGKEGLLVVTPYLSENPEEIGKADEVIEATLTHNLNAVLNAPAQSHRATLQWLKQGSADLAIEEGLAFRIWFVTSGEHDSVELFLKSLKDFPFPHVLVRNRYFINKLTYDYSDIQLNKTLREAVVRYQVPFVELPPFVPSDIDLVRSHALTFAEAVVSPQLKIGERGRIHRAVRTCTDNILEVLGDGSIATAANGDHAPGTESGDSKRAPAKSKRSGKAESV